MQVGLLAKQCGKNKINDMIVREFYRIREDGVKLYRTYSDSNKCIQKIGTTEVYSEAVDVENAPYKYEETDDYIEIFDNLQTWEQER